jgi:hypothetical protein
LNNEPTVPVAVVALVMTGNPTAALTVTLTVPDAVLYLVTSVGVNVTDCGDVPTLGTVVGEVKANVPATDADPPLNVEEESACPDVIAVADGARKITGVVLNGGMTTSMDTVPL